MQDSYHIKDGEVIRVMAFLYHDALTDPSDRRWILNRIAVARGTEKGQGWGTKLLQLICDQADAENATLILGVDPDEPRYFYRLAAWYRKHGFTKKRSTFNHVHNVMVRHPKG